MQLWLPTPALQPWAHQPAHDSRSQLLTTAVSSVVCASESSALFNTHFSPLHRTTPQVALSKKSPYVSTSHRVSGLMLANNTSIRHLFNKIMRDYEKLIGPRNERRAFLDPYAQVRVVLVGW